MAAVAVEQVQEFGERASDLVAPHHRAPVRFSERQTDPHLIADLPDLALQHVANAQRVADLDRIQVGVGNGKARAARADEQAAKAGQFDDQLVRQTLGEEPLVLVSAHDPEGQDRNRTGPLFPDAWVRVGADCSLCRAHLLPEPVDADRLGQVLEASLAEILEGEGRVAPDVVEEHAAHADAVGLGLLLNAGCNVHAVSDEIVTPDHDVGEMKPEAQFQRIAHLSCWPARCGFRSRSAGH